MDLVTSTELRTKTPEVIATLLSGKSVDIVHRSKIVGEIKPKKYQAKPFTAAGIEQLIALTKKLRLPKLTDKQIAARYRKHILTKYGAGLP
jgi:antitoxin (DNA-binding transcriptional repressor) of toxin-antitoxin stability system